MRRATRTPSVPDIRADNFEEVLGALKGIVAVREGQIGDPLDKAATLRDLIALKIAEEDKQGTDSGGNVIPVVPVAPWSPNPDGYNPATDYATPPAPTNLRATGGFTNVYLEWDGAPYRNHQYAEIWRSQVDNLGSAILIGTTPASVFADPAQPDTTYYYWVRFVSVAGVVGPFNNTAGTMARTAIDVSAALTALSEQIYKSPLFLSLGTRIAATETAISEVSEITSNTARYVQTISTVSGQNSSSIQVQAESIDGLSAQYTVKIDANGHVAGFGLAAGPVNGTPTSAFIVRADRFAIVGAADTGDPLGTLTPTKTPFLVTTATTTINGREYPAGTWIDSAYIANATIQSAQIQNLVADKITTGLLTAAVAVSTGKIYGGVNTSWPFGSNNFGTGFYLGYDQTAYKFRVGSPTYNMTWDGTNLTVTGTIYAGAGNIGGITIQANNLRSSNYAANSTGWTITAAGTAEFNSVVARGITIYNSSGSVILSSGSGIPNSAVSGLGAFATLSQITSTNVSTYIASAAIGQAYIANAAIGTAQIANLAVTTGKIASLAVDTLQIAGNAVTLPVAADQASTIYWYGSGTGGVDEWSADGSTLYWKNVVNNISVNFGTVNTTNKAIIGFSYQANSGSGGSWFSRWRIVRDDTVIIKSGDFGVSNNTGGPTVTGIVFDNDTGNGTHTYKLQVAIWGDIGASWDGSAYVARTVVNGTIFALGAKR